MSVTKELSISEIKKQIHNLTTRQSRLRVKEKDPQAFIAKERARGKRYWANLDPEKKAARIAKQAIRNKANRGLISSYQRKSYAKNREKILEKKRLDRIENPEYYAKISTKSYKKNRKKVLAYHKNKRKNDGDKLRARQRELYKLKKENNNE